MRLSAIVLLRVHKVCSRETLVKSAHQRYFINNRVISRSTAIVSTMVMMQSAYVMKHVTVRCVRERERVAT